MPYLGTRFTLKYIYDFVAHAMKKRFSIRKQKCR
jgi:hypothetical protein